MAEQSFGFVADGFGEVGVARQFHEKLAGLHHGAGAFVGAGHLHLRTDPRPPASDQL
ncbi:hypothetical protein D3C80_2226820 [compost metagenome]